MPASFGGVQIFGYQVSITPGDVQRDAQSNSFMGIDGREEIDGGYRERITVARGRLRGLNSAGGLLDLVAAITLFESYRDGNTYTLIDTMNRSWNNVKMVSFTLDPEGYKTTPLEYFQLYTAAFSHLSPA